MTTGSRPPLEETLVNDFDESSGYSSESGGSEDGDPIRPPGKQTELGQNTAEVNNILSSLVKLSFRIRGPAARPPHLDHKALNYKEIISVNETTTCDLFESYSPLDRVHVEEALRQLRKDQVAMEDNTTHQLLTTTQLNAPKTTKETLDNPLVDRWSKSITRRRRIFAYWRRHAKKLAKEERPPQPREIMSQLKSSPSTKPPEIVQSSEVANTNIRPAESHAPSSSGRTLLSGTDATKYRHDGDNFDTVSTISYISTAFDADGSSELPSPPSMKPGQLEFVCPYCHVLCTAREAKGRRWR